MKEFVYASKEHTCMHVCVCECISGAAHRNNRRKRTRELCINVSQMCQKIELQCQAPIEMTCVVSEMTQDKIKIRTHN